MATISPLRIAGRIDAMLAASSTPLRGAFRSSAPRPARLQRPCIMAMAKPTKAADFRELSNEQLATKVTEAKVALASKRFLLRTRGQEDISKQQDTQPAEDKIPKPHEFKALRLQVAQMLTVMRERSLPNAAKGVKGLTRKEVNRTERKAMQAAGF